MPKVKISEFDIDPANNTDINNINIAEGCAPSGINNAIRQLMSDLKEFQTGAGGDPFNGAVNGTVGATTPSTGAFTTLSASSTATLNTLSSSGATITGGSINGTTVGASTASTGAFTSLSASGAFSANGGTTLGDASGDALTINSSAVSIPNGLNFDSNTFVIDATNNRVGIGTSSPAVSLDVTTAASSIANLYSSNASGGEVYFGSAIYKGVLGANFSSATTYIGSLSNHPLLFLTNSTERMRINSAGLVNIGATASASNTYATPLLSVASNTFTAMSIAAHDNTAAANGAYLGLMRSRGTQASPTNLLSGDLIGTITGEVFNTAGSFPYRSSAQISFAADGNHTSGNLPSRIQFFTTSSGGSTTNERMRITSAGDVGIGTSSPSVKLDVVGAITATKNQSSLNLISSSGQSGFATIANSGGVTYVGVEGTGGGASFTGSTANASIIGSGVSSPLQFVTNTTVRATLDASGNLGLGVTPSAWDTTVPVLQVKNASFGGYNNQAILTSNWYYQGGSKYISNGYASQYIQSVGQHEWYTAPSGTAGNAITFTQAMTLDASGNLGIGTTSPSARVTVVNNAPSVATGQILAAYTGYSGVALTQGSTSEGYLWNINNSYLSLGTNNTERMRIDSSGKLLVGTTTAILNSNAIFVSSLNAGCFKTNGAANDYSAILGVRNGNAGNVAEWWYDNSTSVGKISITSTATTYATSSDYRLKNNQAPLTGSGAFIDALQPKTWTWKVDGSTGVGFIAHEVQAVSPNSVVGEKDAIETYIDEDGVEQTRPKYQSMEYGSAEFIANIIAELQDLRKRIAVLESK
jgi:hypothetical protein